MADFYVRAARALQDIIAHRDSIKGATSERANINDAKRLMALVVHTLAYREALQHVLAEIDLVKKEPKWFGSKSSINRTEGSLPDPPLTQCLLLLLAHDLLLAQRGIQAAKAWPPRVSIEKYKSQLHASLVKLQIRRGKRSVEELRSGEAGRKIASRIPRWCRINTLCNDEQTVLGQLKSAGFQLVDQPFLEKESQFTRSRHVSNVLAFHPKATSQLMTLPVFRNGGLILQDLASCFPAAVLDPSQWTKDEVNALDATSAPGNKTSHLSALMKGKGSLTALELAPNRFRTLVKMLGRAGCLQTDGGNVEPKNEDFLKMDPSMLVRCMLLDPSCSGSGIVNRLDYLMSHDDEQDNLEQVVPGESQSGSISSRLANLAALQQRMIRHAMSFPSLERFTYSTCSINEEENEQVVLAVLLSPEAKDGGWTLAPRAEVLPSWPERGRLDACGGDKDIAESLVRCTPGGLQECNEGTVHVEATNGFFVCCFVRKHSTTKRSVQESARAKKRAKH